MGEVDGSEVVEDLDEALALARRRVTTAGERDDRVSGYRTAGKDNVGRRHDLTPFGEHVTDRRLAAAIQDDAECSVVSVLEHQHDGPVEVGVDEGWRGDEQTPTVRSLLEHAPILARGGAHTRP